MDQPLARPHPPEGAGEVVVVALEVLEDRVVPPELARDGAAGGPVAPAAPEGVLEAPSRGRLVGRGARHEALECAADVPADEVEGDPPLPVAEVPEALLVEVVGQPVLAHRLEGGPDAVAVRAAQVTDHDPEVVAQRRARVEGGRSPPHGLDPEGALLDAHRGAALQAHVLGGDPLAVLEARHADVGRRDAHEVGELRRRLHGRELLLPHPVEAVRTGRLEHLGEEALGDLEVGGADLELHGCWRWRGGRTFRSCLRTRSRSRGTGAVTSSGSWRAPRGGSTTSWACSVRRSMSGRSGRPRFGR